MRAGSSFLLALTLLGPAPSLGLTPRLVKDINTIPVPQGSFPQGYARVGGLAFFAADDGVSGTEMWRTDGTVAGTFQVADACPGDCSSRPVIVARTEGAVFFRAFGRGFGPVDLWVTDGSPAGTLRLAGPLLLPDSGRRSLWIASRGLFYFTANDLGLGQGLELWRSDGTPAGTFQVEDLAPGPAGSDPDELTELEGRLFFRANDGEHGPALWTSDGTAQGTRLVRDPRPGTASHLGPFLLRAVGKTLFFVAPVARRRDALWTSDGTPAGTSPLIDFPTSPAAPAFLDAAVLGNRLLFVALDPGRGHELWASNGTKNGTRPLTRFTLTSPFLPLSSSNSRLLPQTPLGSTMIFRANDGVHGVEPWITNGLPGGTRLLRDICPGPCLGAISTDDAGVASTAAGNRLFFSGRNVGAGHRALGDRRYGTRHPPGSRSLPGELQLRARRPACRRRSGVPAGPQRPERPPALALGRHLAGHGPAHGLPAPPPSPALPRVFPWEAPSCSAPLTKTMAGSCGGATARPRAPGFSWT